MGFDLSALELDDLVQDPKKYGAPTFKEFCENYDKITKRDSFGVIDKGSDLFKKSNIVKRHVFEIEGHRCKTLEQVERIAKEYGWDLHQLDYRPEVIPLGGGKADILVKFVSKADRERRHNW